MAWQDELRPPPPREAGHNPNANWRSGSDPGFDFFGPISWPDSPAVTARQKANRGLLQQLMSAHGFTPLPQAWWHFTFADEPFPNTCFDFPIDAAGLTRPAAGRTCTADGAESLTAAGSFRHRFRPCSASSRSGP